MRGPDPRIHQTCKSPLPKSMDCRVKPGNDEGPFSFRGLTRASCAAPCKEQAGNREPSSAPLFYTRRLVLRWTKHAQARLAPLVPSPRAGEGTMVFPRIRMGEGFLAVTHPSPLIVCGSTEPPSPARGEGTIMRTALVVLFTFQTAHLVSPARLRPDVASFASPT
jgi:hypothetical protein